MGCKQFLRGPALFFATLHLWDWALSVNITQWLGDRCWLSTWTTSQCWSPISPCLVHSLNHWYLLFAWPVLEIACTISVLSLPSLPTLTPSLCTAVILTSSLFLESSMVCLPFLAFAHAIPTAWNTFHISLPLPPTFPPFYLANSTYCLGVILDVISFRKLSSPFLSTFSLDELFFLCATSSSCYFLQTQNLPYLL